MSTAVPLVAISVVSALGCTPDDQRRFIVSLFIVGIGSVATIALFGLDAIVDTLSDRVGKVAFIFLVAGTLADDSDLVRISRDLKQVEKDLDALHEVIGTAGFMAPMMTVGAVSEVIAANPNDLRNRPERVSAAIGAQWSRNMEHYAVAASVCHEATHLLADLAEIAERLDRYTSSDPP